MKIDKIPVVLKLLLPLISGILCSYFLEFHVSFFFLSCITAAAVVFCLPFFTRIYSLRKIVGALIIPIFFSLGAFLEELNNSQNSDHYFTKKSNNDSLNFYHLKISDAPILKDDWLKCEVEVVGTNAKTSTGKAQVYIARNDTSEKLKYGDLLYANINFFKINEPSNPHEFNYKEYLRTHDIHHQAFIQQKQWVKVGNDANSFFEFIIETRDKCNSILESSNMSPENIGVAKALIIGDKELVDDELMLSYAASGALHVLAVSGLHVGIVMLILTFIFSPLKKLKRGKTIFLIVAISGVWFYSVLTGLSPSVLRAAVMFSFVILGTGMQRDTSIYQSLLVSALILILIDPHTIFKIGFLLSYLAVFGIVFFHPKIFALLYFKNFILNKTWQITSVSIAAQIATLPIGIYCFQQFPNFFLLANLVVIPLSFVILIVGLAYLIFAAIPFLNDVLLFILDWCVTGLNVSVKWVEQLPYSVFWGISIQWFDVLLLYGFIFSFTFALIQKGKKLLFLSFLLLTFSVCINLIEKFHFQNQNRLVIYSIKNEIAIDVFYGQQIFFFGTETLLNDDNKLRYHIYPNRYHISGTSIPNKITLLNNSNNIVAIEKTKILILNQTILDEKYATTFPSSDFVYLQEIKFLNEQIITHFIINKTKIIFGFNVSNSLKSYLKKRLNQDLLYDLKKSGAIQSRF